MYKAHEHPSYQPLALTPLFSFTLIQCSETQYHRKPSRISYPLRLHNFRLRRRKKIPLKHWNQTELVRCYSCVCSSLVNITNRFCVLLESSWTIPLELTLIRLRFPSIPPGYLFVCIVIQPTIKVERKFPFFLRLRSPVTPLFFLLIACFGAVVASAANETNGWFSMCVRQKKMHTIHKHQYE